jgi:hypothetical protein
VSGVRTTWQGWFLWPVGSLTAVFIVVAPAAAQEGSGFGLEEEAERTVMMEETGPAPEEEVTTDPAGPGVSRRQEPAYERTTVDDSQYTTDADQYAGLPLAETGGLDLAASALGGALALAAGIYLTTVVWRRRSSAGERGNLDA